MFKRKWKYIEHKVQPVSNEEIEISDMLENLVIAIVFNNLIHLESFFIDDAVFFTMKDRVSVSKHDLLKWIKYQKMFWLRKLLYKDVLIKIMEDDKAEVYFTRYTLSSNFEESISSKKFELVKENQVWKISKSLVL